ncbi:TIGR02452 family protein [Kordia sp.]|uniref:TIGR02452 family protein n=1 Tax=Kordia sp. TaxID=1965332 RepID=UPI0025C61417|nr:TIGR02452 family protein [Kordia sp.]MCH2194635.1 TIGR02452 family protein [Kordia sp.]
MKKSTRKLKAIETLDIQKNGRYMFQNTVVHIKDSHAYSVENAAYYTSEALDEMLTTVQLENAYNTSYEVTNETSLSAILRLKEEKNVMCLNFASAKNPGGGFLNGALAQEESLAVASSLYESQMANFEFYERHRNMKSCIYTDSMIYSPKVPFFRDNKGELIENPVLCSVITSAAVNYGVVKRKEAGKAKKVAELMRTRIEKMLALALIEKNDTLILGAWGCGVFQNDLELIAQLFKEVLETTFKNQFKKVVFAIYSRNEKFINAFQKQFKS